MGRTVLELAENGKLLPGKWQTTGITGGSCSDALRPV